MSRPAHELGDGDAEVGQERGDDRPAAALVHRRRLAQRPASGHRGAAGATREGSDGTARWSGGARHRRRSGHRPRHLRAARGGGRGRRRELPAGRRRRPPRRSRPSRRRAASPAPTRPASTTPSRTPRMVDAVVADFGDVDLLVNNGGIASRGNAVADTDPAEMARVVGHPRHRAPPPLPARPAVHAHPAPGRHRDDLVGGHLPPRRQRRAVQHGQGRDGGAGLHAGQGGAPARHPRQRRRARPRRDRHGRSGWPRP